MAHARVTVLIENAAGKPGLRSEHGVSYHVVADGKAGLFDVGASDRILENAKTLGVDLAAVDWIALSHGHNDHTGGLEFVLPAIAGRPDLYAHPAALERKLGLKDGVGRDIGMRMPRDEVESAARIVPSPEPVRITKSVLLSGEIPRTTFFEPPAEHFVKVVNGETAIDTMPDDLSIAIGTPAGWIVLLGCAHSGPVNVLARMKELTGAESFAWVIGGMHLNGVPESRIAKTVASFREMNVEKVAPNHCSGAGAVEAFRKE